MPDQCMCYVATLPARDRFAIRRGAHSALCPVYRPSLDPVDRANDDRLAERLELAASAAVRRD